MPLTVWITTNWKILKEMGIPAHFTCFLRNLYAGQEATVRTGHGTMDCFQIGKGVCQGCILSLCLFNMQSTSCEMQGWIKHKLESGLPGKISIISHMQMTPSLRQIKKRNWGASWWKWKRRVKKAGLKLNIQKNKDQGIQFQHFMANRWGNNEDSDRIYFLGHQNHCRWWLQPEI